VDKISKRPIKPFAAHQSITSDDRIISSSNTMTGNEPHMTAKINKIEQNARNAYRFQQKSANCQTIMAIAIVKLILIYLSIYMSMTQNGTYNLNLFVSGIHRLGLGLVTRLHITAPFTAPHRITQSIFQQNHDI